MLILLIFEAAFADFSEPSYSEGLLGSGRNHQIVLCHCFNISVGFYEANNRQRSEDLRVNNLATADAKNFLIVI